MNQLNYFIVFSFIEKWNKFIGVCFNESFNLFLYNLFAERRPSRERERRSKYLFFFIFTTDFIHKNDKCSKNWTLVIFSPLLFWLWIYAGFFKTNEQEIWKWFNNVQQHISYYFFQLRVVSLSLCKKHWSTTVIKILPSKGCNKILQILIAYCYYKCTWFTANVCGVMLKHGYFSGHKRSRSRSPRRKSRSPHRTREHRSRSPRHK